MAQGQKALDENDKKTSERQIPQGQEAFRHQWRIYPMNRLDIIQQTINKKKANRYLEIGVKKGKVFLNVPARRKLAVDPEFKIKPKKKIKAYIRNASNIFNKY
jgi:hypothetical protein